MFITSTWRLRGRVYSAARLVVYFAFDLPRSALRIRRLARSFDVVHVNASIFLGGILGGFLAAVGGAPRA